MAESGFHITTRVVCSQMRTSEIEVGRVVLAREAKGRSSTELAASVMSLSSAMRQGLFTYTANTLRLLERVAVAIKLNEPLLLVGLACPIPR